MNKIIEIFWLFLAGLLIFSMTYTMSNAETKTTGNLITNGTFENGNSNGWTTSGNVTVLNDCCGSSYDLEFGDFGSIEQTVNLSSDTITEQMLNNGITLQSNIQIQNGECSVSGCWGGQGGADEFTIRLKILDKDNSVLATTTQIRTDTTNINGEYFTDSVAYTGTGSYYGNLFISGSDANAPATLGAGNVDNVSLTMTYDDTVLTETQTQELTTTLSSISEQVIEVVQEIIPENITELFSIEEFELVEVEEMIEVVEVIKEEEFIEEQIVLNTMPEVFEETTTLSSIGEQLVEVETEPIQTEIIQEEIEELETTEVAEVEEMKEEETIEESIEEVNNEPTNEEATTTVANSASSTEEEPRDSNGGTPEDNETAINGEPNETEATETRVSSSEQVELDKIKEQINNTATSVSQKLLLTSDVVAKAMSDKVSMEDYGKTNNAIFNQIQLDGGNLYGYDKQYIDNRVLYADISYNDPVANYQTRVDKAKNETREAEEYLQWILKQ